MDNGETELEMVRRHVREGQTHVERQRELLAQLRAKDEPSTMAETLLSQFETSQRQHEAHLARLESEHGTATEEL
jgi:hypothetical protein